MMFDWRDADNSDALESDEFFSDAQFQTMAAYVDKNYNDAIEFEEFNAMMTRDLSFMWDTLDVNDDYSFDETEAERLGVTDLWFDRKDDDQDGKLSFMEFWW